MAHPIRELDDALLAAIAERRLALRVPVYLPIVVRDGFRRHSGELIDISLTGGRFRFQAPVAAGRRPWVWIPAGLGGRLAHPIGSEVAWTDSPSGAPTGYCQVGLRFRSFPLGGQARLLRAIGELLARATDAAPVDPLPERRGASRVPYARRVIARGAGAPLVMLGRDISSRGISVETRRALAIGDGMLLALHVGGDAPLVLRADVVRAIEDGRWALAFRGLDAAQRRRMDAILLDGSAPQTAGAQTLLVSQVAPEPG